MVSRDIYIIKVHHFDYTHLSGRSINFGRLDNVPVCIKVYIKFCTFCLIFKRHNFYSILLFETRDVQRQLHFYFKADSVSRTSGKSLMT